MDQETNRNHLWGAYLLPKNFTSQGKTETCKIWEGLQELRLTANSVVDTPLATGLQAFPIASVFREEGWREMALQCS